MLKEEMTHRSFTFTLASDRRTLGIFYDISYVECFVERRAPPLPASCFNFH